MATVNFIKNRTQSSTAMRHAIRYVERGDKTRDCTLVSGQNCTPRLAVQEFLATRQVNHKDSGRWFYHYTQSFSPRENVTPEQAHEIAKEFAARAWPESEVVIATHVDAAHIHSHFIVNAVCFETGKMLRQHPNTLQRLRAISDELCMAHGLSVLPKRQKRSDKVSAREYRSAAKGQSWKFRLMNTIDECMRYAKMRGEFIALMRKEGYEVKWSDTRKYITYTTPDGNRCRDNKLHSGKYRKEAMEYEFRIREEIIDGRASGDEPSYAGDGVDRTEPGSSAGNTSYERGMGGDDGLPPHSGLPRRESDRLSENDQRAAGAAPEPDADGRAAEADGDAGADGRTGWEPEREIFLAAQNQTSQATTAAPGWSHMGSSADGAGGAVSALVEIGRRLEQSQFAAPVRDSTTMCYHADRKALRKEKEKKIALGQKEDDHKEEQNWQQTM